ncbi:uncharacterized protein LOC114711446 isoform X2 [Neltuma alba]|uniref:uncharacterized protein LOC114711446 isoform X2 n=1 Tax=Neltuma alba TaxID=207710 RepID=UPI0010A2EEA3|nr:uncharacterized protein LOC114711446 isoform X2 [Prosopis alba]
MLPIFHLLHISGVMEMMSKEGEVGVNTGNDYKGKKVRVCDLVLRALGLVFTLVAAVLVGVDKQTKVVGVQLIDTLPPVNVPVSAKYHYLSAFVLDYLQILCRGECNSNWVRRDECCSNSGTQKRRRKKQRIRESDEVDGCCNGGIAVFCVWSNHSVGSDGVSREFPS